MSHGHVLAGLIEIGTGLAQDRRVTFTGILDRQLVAVGWQVLVAD